MSLGKSSRLGVFYKQGALKNFAKFTRKQLCRSLFLSRVTSLRPVTLSKKRLRHNFFPVNFGKFEEQFFFYVRHLRWLFQIGIKSTRKLISGRYTRH